MVSFDMAPPLKRSIMPKRVPPDVLAMFSKNLDNAAPSMPGVGI
jgi:hypothetical protein